MSGDQGAGPTPSDTEVYCHKDSSWGAQREAPAPEHAEKT